MKRGRGEEKFEVRVYTRKYIIYTKSSVDCLYRTTPLSVVRPELEALLCLAIMHSLMQINHF